MKNVSWDIYFLKLADLISTRSKDPSTKHGCVICDEQKRVISVGYNGPLQGIDDKQIPLTRPEKYPFFLHSEENAMIFSGRSLKGCTAYITGFPCSRCARGLMQAGVVAIVHGNRQSHCVDIKDAEATYQMARLKNVEIISILDNYREGENKLC